jgi:hypothetical protein
VAFGVGAFASYFSPREQSTPSFATRLPPVQPPQPPGTAEVAKTGQDSRPRKRPLAKKILTSVILAIIGVAFGVGAFALYSSPSEQSTPSFASLELDSSFPIGYIGYTVAQLSSSIAEIKINVQLPIGTLSPPAGASVARILISTPSGTTFRTCPKPPAGTAILTKPFCVSAGESRYVWEQPLKFTKVENGSGAASVDLYVRSKSFGVTVNGVNAAASIPEVLYNGSGTPLLQIQYSIPAASSYDWSAFPTVFVNSSYARWNEQLSGSHTDGKTAVGIDHANEANNANKTFIAGILFGLAGAALLSAVQEALHAND